MIWFLVWVAPGAGQPSPIQFAVSVPAAPPEMQLYKLSATKVPVEFLNERLSAIKLPSLKLEHESYIVRDAAGEDGDALVRAFADRVRGDVYVIPNLAELVRGTQPVRPIPVSRVLEVARAALMDPRFVPRDATEVRLAEPITVMGGATAHATPGAGAVRTEPRSVLTIVPAVRYADGFRVYGSGSHALVSLANDGSIVGALRRWRTASGGERIRTIVTVEQVRADIERQLHAVIEGGTRAVVDKIDVAYYDGNAEFLQPVYFFAATIKSESKLDSDIRVAGYVPIGKPREAIPDLAAPAVGTSPTPRVQSEGRFHPENHGRAVTLGEYANQAWPAHSSYVNMGNTFLSGLSAGNAAVAASRPPISRTQWYSAYPWEVLGSSSGSYLNAVNVAYTEPHGNWLWNSTLNHDSDPWKVPEIGTGGNPGFGSATGGVLATWVIMSCEVIPSMYDRQHEASGGSDPYKAFDAWWPVFQGLHNAIGFRTVMHYPHDDLQMGFGLLAALGGDISSAWFQEVVANDLNDGTYNNGHLAGKPLVHYDRGSTMIDARSLGHSIYNVGAQSASTTLWNFWMDN